jgi:hypothetical protein
MDVQQITMDPAKAREAFQAYSSAVKRKYNADFEALAKGYKAIADGKSVIDLHGVLQSAGVDSELRPRFAIARADWQWCYFREVWFREGYTYAFMKSPSLPNQRFWRSYIKIPRDLLNTSANLRCKAQVPMVPAMYLPRGSLGNYHILWEANWISVPADPILLRHLSGGLYAVLAQWDLTPLEQAVMRK